MLNKLNDGQPDMDQSTLSGCLITINKNFQYILKSADAEFLSLCGLTNKSIGCDVGRLFSKEFIEHLNSLYRNHQCNTTYSHHTGEYFTIDIPFSDRKSIDVLINLQFNNSTPEFICSFVPDYRRPSFFHLIDYCYCIINDGDISYTSPGLNILMNRLGTTLKDFLWSKAVPTSIHDIYTFFRYTIATDIFGTMHTLAINIIPSATTRNSYIVFIYEPDSSYKLSKLHTLTPKEYEVVMLVSQGMTNELVAKTLHVSKSCVNKHLSSAYYKLNVSSRMELLNML